MWRLRATLPAARIVPFEQVCAGTGVEAITLYRWAASLALALFDDVAVLEVAMRSAMAREMLAAHGPRWYRRSDLLDDDTLALADRASRSARLDRLDQSDDVLHGKLVASVMFGFWVKMLGRGGWSGADPDRERRVYDSLLWKPALRYAFPGVGPLDRVHVERGARQVQVLRNRIAHHEHVLWGVPLPGERAPDGTPRRVAVSVIHETLLALAGAVDHDLESWLRDHSQVRHVISRCPIDGAGRLHL